MDRRPPYPLSVPVDRGEGPSQIGSAVSYQQPHVLDPDHGPQAVHRSDLLFMNPQPHMNYTKKPDPRQQNPAPPSPISAQLYPYHQQAFYQHYTPPAPPPPSTRPVAYPHHPYPQNPPYYDHRQRATSAPARPPPVIPPPLPPKPIVYPVLEAATATDDGFAPYNALHTRPPPPLPPRIPPPSDQEPPASPEDESNELAMAIALSQSESAQREMLEEQLRRKEEEDLAKALAESAMLSSGSNLQSPDTDHVAGTDDEALNRETRHNSSTVRGRAQSAPENSFSIASSSSTDASHLTDSGYAESLDYDRWNASRASQVQRETNSLYGQQIEEEEEPVITQSFDRDSRVQATEPIPLPRPLSISSASSLPYTRPSPESNKFDSAELEQAYSEDKRPPLVTASALESDAAQSVTEETVLAFDDEAYARQLAAEEEELARQEQDRSEEKRRLAEDDRRSFEGSNLPAYSPVDAQDQLPDKVVPDLSSFQRISTTGLSSRPIEYPVAGSSRFSDYEVRPLSSPSMPSSSIPVLPVVYPSLGQHTESDARSETSHHSSIRSNSNAANNHSDRTLHSDSQSPRQSSNPSPRIASSSPGSPERRASAQAPQLSNQGVLNASHFIDRELLMGVSIGFTPPPISTRLAPMQGPMPNIISLPYARCPPLHLQAPDWSHLLRLMARLSGTRIEPTVEAMAISKTELKLRTVVQFAKPHPSATEWRTIVWFTIDHPVPPNIPGASRYLSGNPNLLPWSYTLSPVPMLLRDAHDTHLSKTYTIPASDAVPLPTLPITFPNLALYLQAALEYSRRHSSDGSSGIGKLGKVVQMCYPNIQQGRSEFDIPERNTMGHLFKRVIGRGGKDKRKGKGTSNEETYQLVTPFVPDEWG